jgi:phenylpyruvate tautomerase PptA (4-oxalocrotonate tautomerase family)
MPLVTIERRKGSKPRAKHQIFEAVHAALIVAFKIAHTDRTQRLIEHSPDDFEIPPGRGERLTIVTIDAFAGRHLEAKRALYREIVTRLELIGIPRDDIVIVLREIPTENWGLRGGSAACDLELGVKARP